jgi:hypothetical protein
MGLILIGIAIGYFIGIGHYAYYRYKKMKKSNG